MVPEGAAEAIEMVVVELTVAYCVVVIVLFAVMTETCVV